MHYLRILYIACMKHNYFIILFSTAILACSSPEKAGESESTQNMETARQLHDIWVLTWMSGYELDAIAFDAGLPNLELNPGDSSAIGFTGCNQLNCSLKASANGSISFGPLATTKMYCTNIPESAYLDYLTKTNSYKRDGLTLTFLADGTEVPRFKKVD